MKSQYISGIYNYCDRWCERCTFTARCRNFENTSKLSPEQLDMNNKAFWENISANFKKAIGLLHTMAKKQGIDLDKPLSKEEEESFQKQEAFLNTTTKNHPMIKFCRNYEKLVHKFFRQPELQEWVRGLAGQVRLGITSPSEGERQVADIDNYIEIIQWYLYFIDAKLQRALHGKLENGDWEEKNGYQKDSDGSAKIALIAIERSTSAWASLLELIPSIEDKALSALALLNQIQRKAKEEFPHAMSFKRPGFDD